MVEERYSPFQLIPDRNKSNTESGVSLMYESQYEESVTDRERSSSGSQREADTDLKTAIHRRHAVDTKRYLATTSERSQKLSFSTDGVLGVGVVDRVSDELPEADVCFPALDSQGSLPDSVEHFVLWLHTTVVFIHCCTKRKRKREKVNERER